MHKLVCLLTIVILMSGCSDNSESADKPFLDITWNMTEMFVEDISYTGSKAPHLRFELERATGNDGCNNFFGPYKQNGVSLSFGLLASTRMACPQIEGFDIAFNKMLAMTTRYRITGNVLELFDDEKLLARLVAEEQR